MDLTNAVILAAFKALLCIFNDLFIKVPVAFPVLVDVGTEKGDNPVTAFFSQFERQCRGCAGDDGKTNIVLFEYVDNFFDRGFFTEKLSKY